MSRSKWIVLAGAWVVAPAGVRAADMPPLLERAPVIEEFSGWYLRGDAGMTNQRTDGYHNIMMDSPRTARYEVTEKGEFDASWFVGLGLGYKFNGWLRGDITGEYRAPSQFHARDRYDDPGNGTGTWDGENIYSAEKSEWLFLANAYVDLGTWHGVTPFVGAGIGFVGLTISDYLDRNPTFGTGGYSPTNTEWNFAWALHAGLGYEIHPGMTVELAYRYVYLGDGKTKDTLTLTGANPVPNNPTVFRDVDSHDVKVALRWQLGGYETVAPLVRKY